MNFDIDKAVDSYEQDIIRDIRRLVKHYSVEGEALPGMPFGKGAADALNEALAISDDLGFKTKNLDNYAGYAEIGEGEKLIGIIGHVDVVPVGDGWKYDPFAGEVHDGVIYGRGVTDDKGSSVAGLYAMKIVKDMGIPLNKRIRFLFGANEETGMAGVKHYKELEGGFDYGFTPDASFPLIFGEKGTYRSYFSGAVNEKGAKVKITSLKGGMAVNVVCDLCVCTLEAGSFAEEIEKAFAAYAEKNNLSCEVAINKDVMTLTLIGVSAHASTPELGVNAISHMMAFLGKINEIKSPFVNGYNKLIGLSYSGENCGVNISDNYGPLTFNVGVISGIDFSANASIDIRYPITVENFEDYSDKMTLAFKDAGLQIDGIEIGRPLYIDPESELVKSLYAAYKEASADSVNKPYTIGGGTYAKCFENIVAFGPEFPNCEYNIHMVDEFMPLAQLKTAVKIYVQALINLLNI